VTGSDLITKTRIIKLSVSQIFTAPNLAGLLSMVFLFAYTFLISLAKGGRWDLYQPLAMSDVGIEYWEPGIQGLASSTPYFPGVAFFLSSLAAVGLPSEESALALAAIVTALVPLSLGYIGRRLGVTMEVGYQTVIYSGFAAIFLNPWIGYSGEFKPDSFALLFFVVGYLLLTSKNPLLVWIAIVPITSSLLMKQQIVAPVLALFLGYLALSLIRRDLSSLRISISIFLSLALAALAILWTPGALFYTVLAHTGRGFLWTLDAGYLRPLLGLGVLLAGGLWLLASKRAGTLRGHLSSVLTPFGFAASAWFAAGSLGALNAGGNAGNLAAGALLFLPLLGVLAKPSSAKKVAAGASFLALLALNLNAFTSGSLVAYQDRVENNSLVRSLVQQASPKRILINSDSYLVVRGLKVEILDLDTWGHIRLGAFAQTLPTTATGILKQVEPDMILCINGCKEFLSTLDAGFLSSEFESRDTFGTGAQLYILRTAD
jgi:hypothetical protein